MVGLSWIEQRKPQQHGEQHPGRPQRMEELASHAANIRPGGRFELLEHEELRTFANKGPRPATQLLGH